MKNSTKEIINEINTYRDESKAAFLPRFFKTGKGEYGEGDQFYRGGRSEFAYCCQKTF